MKRPETTYPDISDILQRKAEGRRDISRRPFGEKIAMMEALRERLAPLKRLREQRRAVKRLRASATRLDAFPRTAFSVISRRLDLFLIS